MFQTFLVRNNERGLLFKEGNFIDVLLPGRYRYFDINRQYHIELYDLKEPRFEHRLFDFLWENDQEKLEKHLVFYSIQQDELGLVSYKGKLIDILIPETRTAFWKASLSVTVDIQSFNPKEVIADPLRKNLLYSVETLVRQKVNQYMYYQEVPQHYQGMLYINKQFNDLLNPGTYAFWTFQQNVELVMMDMRMQMMEVQGQEILTKDKVTLRINLSANYQFTDLEKAYAQTANPTDFLYKELQFALRAAVASHDLDSLLDNKEILGNQLLEHIQPKLEDKGFILHHIGIKDVILPGEMRTLLAKVVEAEKAAQANIILRREETAATRSMMNTAKVMGENPVALRLKELEVLEKIATNIDNLSVYGGLDNLLKELVKFNK